MCISDNSSAKKAHAERDNHKRGKGMNKENRRERIFGNSLNEFSESNTCCLGGVWESDFWGCLMVSNVQNEHFPLYILLFIKFISDLIDSIQL